VIDHYIPQPDQDAGSRSMWCVMQTLVRMGLVVKFWPQNQAYDPDYADLLQQAGIEVIVGKEVQDNFPGWLEANAAHLHFVFLSRPTVAAEFVPVLRSCSTAKILFYGHDLHHARLLMEHALLGSEMTRLEAEKMKRLETSLWRQADVVYYPSSLETQVVRATVPEARAHTLPLFFFEDRANVAGLEQRKDVVFVAGFGHPPNVDAAVWLARSIMPLVRAGAHGKVHLWLVGSNPNDAVQQLASDDVSVTGYVTDERLIELYAAARVAVVPLRIGAGMKGKVVEALHYGVPLVTTPVGAQGLDGLESILTVSADEARLADGICALLRDDELWKRTSSTQLEYVQGRFSIDAIERALRFGLQPPECNRPADSAASGRE